MREKENIILAPGPLHLFWTGSVYYLWELSRVYNVVLVVEESYKNNASFIRAAELCGTAEILYCPAGNALARHRFYASEFRRLIEKYRPGAVFHHDPVHVPMMYLYHFGKSLVPGFLRISFLTGMASIYREFNHRAIVDFDAEMMAGKLGIPRGAAKFIREVKGWLSLGLNFYLLPLLFAGKIFRPPMNLTNGKILKKYWNDIFDYYLLYSGLDARAIANYCGSEDGFVRVKHPLESSGREFNARFYALEEKDSVVIMPTYGYINTYQREHGLSDDAIVRLLASKWAEALRILKVKFPGYGFYLKLHPAQEKDQLWAKIVGELRGKHPDLNLVNPRENGQEWILRSKVVVGDFSSVLWWASCLETKTSISLDVFGTRCTDEMKYRRNAWYFTTLEEFEKADLSGRKPAAGEPGPLPTLTEFLRKALPEHKI